MGAMAVDGQKLDPSGLTKETPITKESESLKESSVARDRLDTPITIQEGLPTMGTQRSPPNWAAFVSAVPIDPARMVSNDHRFRP